MNATSETSSDSRNLEGGRYPREFMGGALLTDLYQLTMLQAYFDGAMNAPAVFEFFVRKPPANRNFLIAAGLAQALEFLESFHFSRDELDWLAGTGLFRPQFLEWLSKLRFTGDVDAMPEGTIFFPNEPILRVTAPLPEAQIVETRLINLLQLQSLVASKAARCVLAGRGKRLVDFGLRRTHGAEAGLLGARACFAAGFDATSNLLAGRLFGIPISGTMAHSFIQAHEREMDAFLRFAESNPSNVVLLLDTYDTENAARAAVRLAEVLRRRGIGIRGVRLDSGDLAAHARNVRQILDEGGLNGVSIFASGNIDEFAIHELVEQGAPIDGFGVGTKVLTSADAPYLDCAYKIQEYAGRATRKWSEGKATLPGRKQVCRVFDAQGRIERDWIGLEEEALPGEPLLKPVMRNGTILGRETLARIRARVAQELAALPPESRSIAAAGPPAISVSPGLLALSSRTDARMRERGLQEEPPRAGNKQQNLGKT